MAYNTVGKLKEVRIIWDCSLIRTFSVTKEFASIIGGAEVSSGVDFAFTVPFFPFKDGLTVGLAFADASLDSLCFLGRKKRKQS